MVLINGVEIGNAAGTVTVIGMMMTDPDYPDIFVNEAGFPVRFAKVPNGADITINGDERLNNGDIILIRTDNIVGEINIKNTGGDGGSTDVLFLPSVEDIIAKVIPAPVVE